MKANQLIRLVSTVILRLSCVLKPPGELVKAQITAKTPRVADLLGLGWRICISNKFPGDTDATGRGPHFEKHWVKGMACFHSLNKLFVRTLNRKLVGSRNDN